MIKFIKFSAKWCGPCQALVPIFNNLKKNFPNVNFVEIDVDQNRIIAIQYMVSSVPCVVLEKDGKEINRIVGIQHINSYVNLINNSL